MIDLLNRVLVGGPTYTGARMPRVVWRFRVAVTCLLLTTACFLQDPGLTAADTKLDLTQNPWGFLRRAITLWDDQSFFGQLQDQAYGYLWPMGPFFGVGHSLGLPPWVVQRLWWSLILCVALLGMLRLTRLLGVVSPGARMVAALGFALAPRMLSTMGPTSIEAWPMALAPWLLIPLVMGSRGGSPRRWAALSAVVFLCVGGVNAVATAAILPVGVVWLVSRRAGPRRRALARWWVAGIGLASLWWAIPLLLLGRYSPPFLDWIESASVTTRPNEPGAVLRGTSAWVPYIAGVSGPEWGAGWQLVSTPLLVLACAVIAAAGLAGLARLDIPERGFLLATLGVGLVLVSLGHVGATSGPVSAWVQTLLDGPLAPIRNVHKFEPVVALALAVGLGHCVDQLLTRPRPRARTRVVSTAALACVVAALLGVAWPLASGGITRGRTYESVPGYWAETATWLAAQSGDGVALVVPSSSFGVFLWGRTQDEPLQPLAHSRWASRSALPLSGAGNIRMLDSVNESLVTGRGSAALTEVLQRSGVRWLVVPNDRDTRPAGGSLRSVLVQQALQNSPGISAAASFGPLITPFGYSGNVVDAGLDTTLPAVQVYEVAPETGVLDARVVLRSMAKAVRVAGGAESTLALAGAGLLRGRALLVGPPPASESVGSSVLTDQPTRTEVDFGLPVESRTNVLGADDAMRRSRSVHDYAVRNATSPVVASEVGVRVSASTSLAWPGTPIALDRGAAPSSAVDLDSETAWLPQTDELDGTAWWEGRWDEPRDPQGVTAWVAADPVTGQAPEVLTVETATGTAVTPVTSHDGPVVVRTPPGATSWLRITLGAVEGGHIGRRIGLREVAIPGVISARPLVVPPGSAVGGIVLSAPQGDVASCVSLPLRVVCPPGLGRPGEERAGIDRVVTIAQGGTYVVRVHAHSRGGVALDQALAPAGEAIKVAASSVGVDSPASRAQAAADGDGSTVWTAARGDTRPRLTFRLPESRLVSGVFLDVPDDAAVSRPLVIDVTMRPGATPIRAFVSADGSVELPPMMTQQVSIDFVSSSPLRSIDTQRGIQTLLPVGVAEVVLRGAADLNVAVDRTSRTELPCGTGPVLEVDGTVASDTRVVSTAGDLLLGHSIVASGCTGPVTLTAGEHRIRVRSTDALVVEQVDLLPPGVTLPVRASSPTVTSWTATDRSMDIRYSAEQRILELSQNVNAGWTASLDGVELEPVTVDGWRQGWMLPAGATGTVLMSYPPARLATGGLVAGGATALLLLILLATPTTRRQRNSMALAALSHRDPAFGAAVAGIAVIVVGGWIGLAAVAIGLASLRLSRNSSRQALVVSLPLVLGIAEVVAPWPATLEVPVWLAWASALGWLAAVSIAAAGGLGGRWLMSGADGTAQREQRSLE
ncbi:unannotated protein [freshwater metagenome]|uniref:Unannotated protein n=1 Tax=freshwater metagenome TaxID=449393 RepID=A0A6J7IRG8_9ZZZZ